MPDDKPSDGNALEEWKEARSTVSRFENNLHDVRKYGLTIITGLLAANSIQIYFSFNNFTRFFLTLITIVFIVCLLLLDLFYQRIAEAASIRARILETKVLNIELDETITFRFTHEKLSSYIKMIYIGFIVIAVVIGVVVIAASPSTQPATLVNSSTSGNSGVPQSTLVNSSTLINSSSLIYSSTSINSSIVSTNLVNSSASAGSKNPIVILDLFLWSIKNVVLCSILLTFIFFIGCRLIDNYLLDEIDKCNKLSHKFEQLLPSLIPYQGDNSPSKTGKRNTLREECRNRCTQIKKQIYKNQIDKNRK